jgi:hypothetical protein
MSARIILALMTAISCGCGTISEKGCTPRDTPVEFVTSSGRYCVARSIVIPADGLSLGNAVQQVLRVPHCSVIAHGITPVMQTTANRLPQEASSIALDLGAKAAEHFEVSGDANDARANGIKDNISHLITQAQWRILEPEIRLCFERALAAGMLAGPAADALDGLPVSDPDTIRQKAVRSSLAMELEATLVFGLLWQDSSTPAPAEETISTTVDLIIATQTMNFRKQAPFVQSQQMDAVRAQVQESIKAGELWPRQPDSIRVALSLLHSIRQQSEDLAVSNTTLSAADSSRHDDEVGAVEQSLVTLVQHNGRILSAPLWLVTNYSAGDILLAPNDHIEVNAFSQTSFGSPALQSAEGNILALGPMADPEGFSIESISGTHGSFEEFARTKGNGIADVVVIRRIELSGQLHDFILPIPQPEVFACAGAASEMMREIRLQPGDQIHLEVLDLTPMIRESRRISQLASRDAIEEAASLERDARQSWVAKKLRKKHEKKQLACARISSQTELITGMNPSDFARLTGDRRLCGTLTAENVP